MGKVLRGQCDRQAIYDRPKYSISDMLVKKFGQWKYVVVVYPPHQGGHKHYSNYDILKI